VAIEMSWVPVTADDGRVRMELRWVQPQAETAESVVAQTALAA